MPGASRSAESANGTFRPQPVAASMSARERAADIARQIDRKPPSHMGGARESISDLKSIKTRAKLALQKKGADPRTF
jgi:hypothetical protein